jgi:hypothetical protein
MPPKSVTGPAHNAANAATLNEHLRQAEKYGAAGFKELQNGRFRYLGNLKAPPNLIAEIDIEKTGPTTIDNLSRFNPKEYD